MRSLRLLAVIAPLCAFASYPASSAESGDQGFDLRAGQEITFAVAIGADGKAAIGAPHPSKLGAAQPRAGEITVGLTPKDKTLYEQVTVTEKTPVPINFLATGLVGGTKIDEAVLCGRLDAPFSARIGAMSWKVRVHDFEVAKDGVKCD